MRDDGGTDGLIIPNQQMSCLTKLYGLFHTIPNYKQLSLNISSNTTQLTDRQTGPYLSIQEAIDASQPNSIIKISEGFYEENIKITKPLTLQPKSDIKLHQIGVILLVSSGVAIKVRLPEMADVCTITGIKISHSGNTMSTLQEELIEHKHILNFFQSDEQEMELLEQEYVNRVSLHKVQNMILYVEKGIVQSRNCVYSLSYLVKSCTNVIPAICISKDGILRLSQCEIVGHPQKHTIGILCKLGVLTMVDCIIKAHNDGGLLIWGVKGNQSSVIRNVWANNSVGVHVVGEQNPMHIYSNNFTQNKLGVKVGLASMVDISRNSFYENGDGIEINSAFPIIYLNKIQRHTNNGIICRSYKRYLCEAEVKKNISIAGNEKNGILIEGENNRTRVIQNYMIGFNGESGIRVDKEANPYIGYNRVYKNRGEGILVVETANATIQKNEITHNLACNVACGGISSYHTLIVENIIKGSYGPGVVMVNMRRAKLYRNDIANNRTNGVYVVGCRFPQTLIRAVQMFIFKPDYPIFSQGTELRHNCIYENQDNGILCSASKPTIVENFITRNKSIGVFLRKEWVGLQMHSNVIVQNQISIGIDEHVDEALRDNLRNSNTIDGDIILPKSTSCDIM